MFVYDRNPLRCCSFPVGTGVYGRAMTESATRTGTADDAPVTSPPRRRSTRPDQLSRSQARRITLAAQGFLDPPHHTPTLRTLTRAVRRTGVLQIDSVNVLQRAHYMPLYARIGPYPVELLHRAASRNPRVLVEYWAHVAAFMPVDLWPVMQHRMRRYAQREWEVAREHPQLMSDLLQIVAAEGPRTASQLDTSERRGGGWWNWSVTKQALEYLFFTGQVAISGRTSQFERLYDLPERVLPAHVLNTPEPSPQDASRELVRRAVRSHGVATVAEIADYYRMKTAAAKTALIELQESDEVTPVAVEGSRAQAYLDTSARIPRRVDVSTLLSPFDPIVWHRGRSEHLFDFHYRIEIYTPEHKRVHGYYVLPFLLGDRIAARVDLKAERPRGELVVKAAFAEPSAPTETAARLAAELARLAGWLGLERIRVELKGDLAPALLAEVAASAPSEVLT